MKSILNGINYSSIVINRILTVIYCKIAQYTVNQKQFITVNLNYSNLLQCSSGTWPHPHDVCDAQKSTSEDLPLATCQDLRCYIAEHLNTGRLVSNGSSEKKEI